MASLDNNILVLFEPTIRPTKVEVKTLDEDKEGPKQTKGVGIDKPHVIINGYEFGPTDIRRFSLDITGKIPTISLTVQDSQGSFSVGQYPRDGDCITVYIGTKNPETFKAIHMDFDIVDVSSRKVGIPHKAKKYSFTGVAKIPNLRSEDCKSLGEGSSIDHLEQIALELGLGFASNIASTDDTQIRVQPFSTTLQFISNIVGSSYAGEEAFQTYFIDQYYNLNFVEVNKVFNSPNLKGDDIQDSITSLRKSTNQDMGTDPKAGDELPTKLVLTNNTAANGTDQKIAQFSLENNAMAISLREGYKRVLQMYDDLESTDRVTEFDVESFTSTNITDVEGPLKGNPSESRYSTEYKYKYVGRSQDYSLQGNSHINYKYSLLNNHQNLRELEKMKLIVELESFNPSLYMYQKIPVQMYLFEKGEVEGADTVNEELKKKGVKADPKEENAKLKEEEQPQRIDQFTSGHYVIGGIEYIYKDGDPSIRQRVTLLRREWPIRVNSI